MEVNRKNLPYRVFIYYLVMFIGLAALARIFPGGEEAPALAAGSAELQAALENSVPAAGAENAAGINFFNARALALLVALIFTVAFTIPLAWTYSLTGPRSKQHGSILETIFLLPITVASVVVIVQNSIALAFSLAGIVAAVRFRSNIKTPGDAVFVFAALAIGLSAGVSEIGVAGIGSMFFCFTYIVLRMTGVVKDYEAPPESLEEEGEARPPENEFAAPPGGTPQGTPLGAVGYSTGGDGTPK